MLKTDIGLEAEAIKMYNEAAVVCAAEKDQISKELFEELLKTKRGMWTCLTISRTTLINSEPRIWPPSQANPFEQD